jgi:hypothetical protein
MKEAGTKPLHSASFFRHSEVKNNLREYEDFISDIKQHNIPDFGNQNEQQFDLFGS